jgi:hypothetical protein
MAKKKQFAGKKTKLAKLPLTQALASQVDRGVPSAAPFTPPPSPSRQLPLTWDEALAGQGEPLLATFLFLIRELADLNSHLQSNPEPPVINHPIFLPNRIPAHTHMVDALREARESLRDLKSKLTAF